MLKQINNRRKFKPHFAYHVLFASNFLNSRSVTHFLCHHPPTACNPHRHLSRFNLETNSQKCLGKVECSYGRYGVPRKRLKDLLRYGLEKTTQFEIRAVGKLLLQRKLFRLFRSAYNYVMRNRFFPQISLRNCGKDFKVSSNLMLNWTSSMYERKSEQSMRENEKIVDFLPKKSNRLLFPRLNWFSSFFRHKTHFPLWESNVAEALDEFFKAIEFFIFLCTETLLVMMLSFVETQFYEKLNWKAS